MVFTRAAYNISKPQLVRDILSWMSTVNWPRRGYVRGMNVTGPDYKVAPVEIQTVHAAKGRDYLKWIRDLERQWYTVFNQKAYKDWKSYDLRSRKDI